MSPNGNSRSVRKAMLLAAGLGTRLRPLTHTTPKPLLPIGDRPLIDYALANLRDAGVREVMINLHYLPESIRQHVGDGLAWQLRAHYSFEPIILGTGGGIQNVAAFFGDDAFVIYNADCLCHIDLRAVIAAHQRMPHAAATLAIRTLYPGETYTPLTVEQSRITALDSGSHHYTGIMLATSALLQQLPKQHPSCLIRDGLAPLLDAGATIGAHLHTDYWNDIGTPERYAAAQADVERGVL